MGRLTLKNVTERPRGSGNLYFRRKIAGKDSYIRLPAIDSPDFAAEYARLAAPEPQRPRPASGTLAAIVESYRASEDFKAKDPKTKINQARYLDMIAAEHGHRTVKGIRPVHVFIMRDKLAETPGKANNWLSVFKTLMKHAIREDLRTDNPAQHVPIFQTGEHEPWPADLLAVCLEQATPMTRLAIVTGLCSGQRIGDCIRMQYGWIGADGIMSFPQQKKRRGGVIKEVAFPMHPFWLEELAKLPRKSVTLLYERTGAPFKTTAALQERLRALMKKEAVQQVLADLVAREVVKTDTAFTFHGLRKNACCYLIECGLNDQQIGEMLGMSPEMVRHYGKRARALMVARGAAERMTGGTILQMTGRRKA